ncbi:hypothetical protein [Actibacterium sp. 188UL27-1]|uniref:hypothetical protein n=1 Tax=Actibacterium sp. 188UL27-1 TaxID=2786961 RepID=UPI001EF6218C|nr:hypothetical protein [Actibacterium sp. 188UL27-1]
MSRIGSRKSAQLRWSRRDLVGGQGFAVDGSLISADVQKQNSGNPQDGAAREIDPTDAPRAVREYLDTLDDKAFGATTAKPKFTAHADPASQWTAARKGCAIGSSTMANAFFAYSDNYPIDTGHGIPMNVDASRSNKTAEVGAMRKMPDRTEERFGMKPDWIAADTAYGSSDTLVWLALKRQILPFIPVFDKGERTDGTFRRIRHCRSDQWRDKAHLDLSRFRAATSARSSHLTFEGDRAFPAPRRPAARTGP